MGTAPTRGLQWTIYLGVEQAPELALEAQGWAGTSYGPLGLGLLEPEHGLLGPADPIKLMTGHLP